MARAASSTDKRTRQRPAHPRRADGAGGGIFQHAFLGKEFVEAAHRGHRPLHAARAQAFLAAMGDEGTNIGGRQFGQRFLAHRPAGMVA